MTLVYIAAVVSVLFLSGHLLAKIHAARLRRRGVLPTKGEASPEDVRRLLEEGREIMALRVYRELHPEASLKEAKEAVTRLKVSLSS